jgi:acyl carrier protein
MSIDAPRTLAAQEREFYDLPTRVRAIVMNNLEWLDATASAEVTDEHHLVDLGVDSLDRAMLEGELESAFCIEIDSQRFALVGTIADVIAFVAEAVDRENTKAGEHVEGKLDRAIDLTRVVRGEGSD